MTDLDRATLDRILPPTPEPADWDDVMSRARRADRRRRLRIVVLAATVLVVVVGAASAIGGVRGFILDRGFIGLPPEGATPSAPESGEIVLHWDGRSATHATPHRRGGYGLPFIRVWVYADGRMIWQRDGQVPEGANELTSGYLEQRLTPEGVELLRSELLASGLFDHSLTLVVPRGTEETPNLLTSAGEPVSCANTQVRSGDRLVSGPRCVIPEEPEARAGTPVTPEQLSALRRIDALFTDPASQLPPSAWAVRKVRAYVPSHYAVCIDTSPPKELPGLLSLLPARAADVLREESWTRRGGEVVEAREGGRTVVLGQSVTYCSKLVTDEAREVANAVSGLARHPGGSSTLIYDVAEAVGNLNPTTISFNPYFPHGQFLLYDGGR